MIYLIIIAVFSAGPGRASEMRTLEIPALSRQDCIEGLREAFSKPYVLEAKCEIRMVRRSEK